MPAASLSNSSNRTRTQRTDLQIWAYGSPDTVTSVKTTIELPDDLLAQVREVARHEQTTMRELMIEGLRLALERHGSPTRTGIVFPTFGSGSR